MAYTLREVIGISVTGPGTSDTTVQHAISFVDECTNRAWSDGLRPVILYTKGGVVQIGTLTADNKPSAYENFLLAELRDQRVAEGQLRHRANVLGISPAALAKLVNKHAPHG